jgi:hypothetical protein
VSFVRRREQKIARPHRGESIAAPEIPVPGGDDVKLEASKNCWIFAV